jgi:hypothetical protein
MKNKKEYKSIQKAGNETNMQEKQKKEKGIRLTIKVKRTDSADKHEKTNLNRQFKFVYIFVKAI